MKKKELGKKNTEENCQYRMLYSVNVSFKNKDEIKMFSKSKANVNYWHKKY